MCFKRWCQPSFLAFSVVTLLIASGCDAGRVGVHSTASDQHVRVSDGLPWSRLRRVPVDRSTSPSGNRLIFAALSTECGLDFTYRNGARGHQLMSEATGAGCGWGDFDRDGWWDLFLVQGGFSDSPDDKQQASDQLLQNCLGQFSNVTLRARIAETKYGQGVAIGDLDNDGFDDIFVTNLGGNALWRNQGDGTVVEMTEWSDSRWNGWSTSAAWGDVDRDGDLDLYVANYCDFDPRSPLICRNTDGQKIQCQPNQVPPVPDQFFENLGTGKFRECAAERGLFGEGNRALGVVIADLVGDERPEIYVANDATANFLFVEETHRQYVDQAVRFGCAVDANGNAQASMGVAVGDYDRNGQLDVYLTHFEGEWNTLYGNFGATGFRDVTGETGGVDLTLPMVGFGVAWQDFDQDGHDDLFIANGHIDDFGRRRVLAMPPQLLTFDGKRWRDVGAQAGAYFGEVYVGRGVAEADYDSDGDFDLAVVAQNSPTQLLENRSLRGHWLGCEFVGRTSNRRGIGTRVTLIQGERQLVQELVGGGGYCSSRQPLLLFGLGDHSEPCELHIRWPSGLTQQLSQVTVDQKLVIVENVTPTSLSAELFK